MEIERTGPGSIRLTLKKSTILYNPDQTGGKKGHAGPSAVLLSSPEPKQEFGSAKLVISSPGEYEAEDISVHGIGAAAAGGEPINVFRVAHDVTSVVCMPALPPESLNDSLLEAIGVVDVLVISIAAYNGELDPLEAAKIVRLLEPRVVIPIGYAKRSEEVEKFLSEIGGVTEQAAIFKVKAVPPPGEALHAVLLDILG